MNCEVCDREIDALDSCCDFCSASYAVERLDNGSLVRILTGVPEPETYITNLRTRIRELEEAFDIMRMVSLAPSDVSGGRMWSHAIELRHGSSVGTPKSKEE